MSAVESIRVWKNPMYSVVVPSEGFAGYGMLLTSWSVRSAHPVHPWTVSSAASGNGALNVLNTGKPCGHWFGNFMMIQ